MYRALLKNPVITVVICSLLTVSCIKLQQQASSGDYVIKRRVNLYFVDSNGNNVVGLDSLHYDSYDIRGQQPARGDTTWSILNWKESATGPFVDELMFTQMAPSEEYFAGMMFDKLSWIKFGSNVDTLYIRKRDREKIEVFWNGKLVQEIPAMDTARKTIYMVRNGK